MSLIPVFSPVTSAYRVGELSFVQSIPLAVTSRRAFWFKPDGTELFYNGDDTANVARLAMSVPWDISTATDNGQISITPNSSGGVSNGGGLFLKNNETDVILTVRAGTANYFEQFRDNGSGTYNYFFRIAAPSGDPITGSTFTPDGLKLLAVSSSGQYYETSMATPFDLQTTTGVWTATINLAFFHPNMSGFCFGKTARQVVLTEIFSAGGDREFHENRLAADGDMSGATLVRSHDYFADGLSNITDVAFGDGGRRFFGIGANAIAEYDATA